MKHSTLLAAALSAIAIGVAPDASAIVLTVGQTGAEDFSDVQSAIDAAEDGDEIEVRRGHYVGALDLLGKGLLIRGVQGRGVTRLEVGCYTGIDMWDVPPGAGFEEVSFYSTCVGEDYGAGAPGVPGYRSDGTEWRGVVFHSNGGEATLGASEGDFPATIHDSAFIGYDNAGRFQVTLNYRALMLSRVLVAGSVAPTTLLGGHPDPITMRNVLINSPWVAAALSAEFGSPYEEGETNSVLIENTTVAQGASRWTNEFAHGVAVDLVQNGAPALRNNIFAYSPGSTYASCNYRSIDGVPAIDSRYSDAFPLPGVPIHTYWPNQRSACYLSSALLPVVDPTGTDGNISEDPMFTAWSDDGDWLNDNFCLAPGSPAIDSGDPDPAKNDPDGTRNDMGAFGGPDAPDCTYMIDWDGDGWMPITGDCDDGDSLVFPDAEGEVECDGVDTDCDTFDGGEPCPPGDDDDAVDDDDALDDDDSATDDDDALDDDDSSDDAPVPSDCSCTDAATPRAAGFAIFALAGVGLGRRKP